MVVFLGIIPLNAVENVAVMLLVISNRRSQLVAHLFENPLDRRPGTFHPGLQRTPGDGIPMGQKEGVKGVDAVKLIHYSYGKKPGFFEKVSERLIGDIWTIFNVKNTRLSIAFYC